jgi:anti-sigma regulatory factor (Ser/Thr protein kinase)
MTLFYRYVFILLLGASSAMHAFGSQPMEAIPSFEQVQKKFSEHGSQLELIFPQNPSNSLQDQAPVFIVSNNPLVRNLELFTTDRRSENISPLKLLFGGKVWIKPPLRDTLVLVNTSYHFGPTSITCMSANEFLEYRQNVGMFLGLYLGIIFLVIAVSLSIYWYNGEKNFRNFSAMCVGIALAQLSIHAFGADYLETFTFLSESTTVVFCANLSLVGSLFFIQHFLKQKHEVRAFPWVVRCFYLVGGFSIVLSMMDLETWSYFVLIWNNLLAAIWITWVTLLAYQRRHEGAGIFLLAWSFFSCGVVLYILKDLGVLPWNWITQNGMAMGSGIECVFIGLAISFRMRRLSEEKDLFYEQKERANLAKIALQEENKKLSKQLDDVRQKLFLLQLKPHYIANSLNNINSLILRRRNTTASKYIVNFGRLMRQMLHQPKNDFILMHEECTALNAFLVMENLRLKDRLDIQIRCSENINMKEISLPNMLIQPLIENAIIHGLQNLKSRKPKLLIEFIRRQNHIEVRVDDNGLGRQRKANAKPNQPRSLSKMRTSVGTKLIQQRLSILCQGEDYIPFEIIDKFTSKGHPAGVCAIVRLPFQLMESPSNLNQKHPFEVKWLKK